MKRFLGLAVLLLMSSAVVAQLPSKFAIIAGGGMSFPYVKQYDYDFYAKYGDRGGYNLLAEGRYYFTNEDELALGVGLAFDYMNHNAHGDKQHTYFGRPEFVIRLSLDDDDKNALFMTLGAGLMHYEEKMAPIIGASNNYEKQYGHEFHRNYFGFGSGLGYEFAIAKGFGGMIRFDYNCAGIFWSSRVRLFDVYGNPYDNGEYQWLRSRLQFFNVSFALQFGM